MDIWLDRIALWLAPLGVGVSLAQQAWIPFIIFLVLGILTYAEMKNSA